MSYGGYDYEEDLRIDHNALDIESIRQPQLFMKYSELAADARLEMDRIKELVEVVRAECDKKIRDDLGQQGVKVTEAIVANQIVLRQDYREVVDKLSIARHRWEILSMAVKAFEQKKSSIENLIKLMLASYFSSPTIPRDLDKEIGGSLLKEKVESGERELVREKMRTKRNKT